MYFWAPAPRWVAWSSESGAAIRGVPTAMQSTPKQSDWRSIFSPPIYAERRLEDTSLALRADARAPLTLCAKSCRQQPTQDLLTRETTSLWYCTAFQIRSASIPYPRTSCRMTGATWHHRFVTAPSPSTDQRGGAANDVVPLHQPSG